MAPRPYIWSLVLSLALVCSAPIFAHAASLSLSPATARYSVGSTFSVSVFVSSEESLNAVSGVIAYPKDKLAVTGISKAGSILNLWVQEPSFLNSDGVASFEGVVLNTGFTGSAGKLLTLTFSVLAPGQADITFSSGMALANDGEGSDLLEGLRSARYTLVSEEPLSTIPVVPGVEAPEVASVPRVGIVPVIESSTHPDQNGWYSSRTASFVWDNPEGAVATRLLIDTEPNSTPNVVYAQPLTSKEVRDLEDGIWYFHAQSKVGTSWSETGHYKIQIDSSAPSEAVITEIRRTDTTDPVALFALMAKDAGSGVASFGVSVDGAEEVAIPYTPDATFKTEALLPGNHTALLIARDHAGNETRAEVDFTIEPIAAPRILEYPSRLLVGDTFVLTGNASDGIVHLVLEGEGTNDTFTADAHAGVFRLEAHPKLTPGIYRASAYVIDARGAVSPRSDMMVIHVEGGAFIRWGTLTISVLSVLVPLIALLVSLGLVLFFGWHKYVHLRKVQEREIKEAQTVVHRAFTLFREDIDAHIQALEKARKRRILTREEKRLLKQLTKNAEEAETVILKEIGDIERAK